MTARPAREANRLKQYDYSQTGYYFVTICIQDRVCLLGDIVNDNMILNNAGKMIENSWRQIPDYYDGVEIDSCQIMPNHLRLHKVLENDAFMHMNRVREYIRITRQGTSAAARGAVVTDDERRK